MSLILLDGLIVSHNASVDAAPNILQYFTQSGFDSFMDHSCAPSTEQEYISKHEYVVRAKKTILPGDKITCDYMALENTVVNMKNLGTSSFVCKCGESNCKGELVC